MATRLVLIVLSAALGVSEFLLSNPASLTRAGHAVASAAYGFSPALFGALFAWFREWVRKRPSLPLDFRRTWHWAWGVMLVILAGQHLPLLFRALASVS